MSTKSESPNGDNTEKRTKVTPDNRVGSTAGKAPIPTAIIILLVSVAFSTFAGSMLATVVGLQIFAISGSEFDLGLVGLVEFLPILLLSPFTGVLADRFNRKLVYLAGLLIDTAVPVAIAFYVSAGAHSVTPILILMGIYGVGKAVGVPAGRSLPIDLADTSNLDRVIALRSMTFQVGLVIGPIVGSLANRTSWVLPYQIMIAAQVVAAILLFWVHSPKQQLLATEQDIFQTLRDAFDGIKYIRRNPYIFGAITLDLFAVLFGGMVALLPAIVEKRLNFDDVDLGVGIIRTAIAASAGITAALIAAKPIDRFTGKRLFQTIALFGVANIALGLATNFWFALFTQIVAAAADQINVYIRSTIVPLASPQTMRGRVLAVENVFIGGSNQLGAFESGVTAKLFGLAPAVIIGGIGTLIVVGTCWYAFPVLRKVDRFTEVVPVAASDPNTN